MDIHTIGDLNPSKNFLLDADYKSLRRAVRGKSKDDSFSVTPELSAQHLLVLGLIKRETKRIRDPDNPFLHEDTGMYTLTIDGEYYLQYRCQEFWKLVNDHVRWIIATVLSVLALVVSTIALLK